jgi:branched-chain amino acid transport system ATP-binding protein
MKMLSRPIWEKIMPLLEVNNINVSYGDVQVIFDLSLNVEKGEVVSIIGGNGAGKSTLLKTISGLMSASAGDIHFAGETITKQPPENIVTAGIIQVPEGRRLFPLMSVKDNLIVGAYNKRASKDAEKTLRQVYELLPRLEERENQMAMTLSGGEQQMVAIGRGLMAKPHLLMLDEPSLGLAPILIKDIFETVRKIADQGTTVLMVEQDVKHSLSLSDRGYVLEHGRVAMEGRAQDLIDDPHIKEAYLGI